MSWTVSSSDSSTLSMGLPTKLAKDALGKLSPAKPIFMYPVPGSQIIGLLSIYSNKYQGESKRYLNIEIWMVKRRIIDCSVGFFFNFSPEEVVFSRNRSSQFGNQVLKPPPKVDVFEDGVHPAIYDAVGRIKISLMMNVMLLVTNNQTRFLQKLHYWVGFLVYHVSPFVAFVRQDPSHYRKDNHPVASLRKECSRGTHQAGPNEEGHWV